MCDQHNVSAAATDNTGHTSSPRIEIKILDPAENLNEPPRRVERLALKKSFHGDGLSISIIKIVTRAQV